MQIQETFEQVMPASFYNRDTIVVAKELLGKVLVRKIGKVYLAGRITETESYVGQNDAACHASRGRTERNEIMFGKAGHAYVYLIYGMHNCLNVVTEAENFPAAVSIRSLEPLLGWTQMYQNRNLSPTKESLIQLANGPGKLTRALGITRKLNGHNMTIGSRIWVIDDGYEVAEVVSGPRIGVEYAGADAWLPWRFGIKDSAFLSRPF